MKPKMKFLLTHNGKDWIAKNGDNLARGRTLEELDEQLRNKVKEKYCFEKGTRVEVNMEFDYKTIPFWITQYHPYYFNRAIYVDF